MRTRRASIMRWLAAAGLVVLAPAVTAAGSVFAGTWVSIDTDGSTQALAIGPLTGWGLALGIASAIGLVVLHTRTEAGAVLWLGLSRWAVDLLRIEGFTPVVPPVLVRREAMEGTGFLPTEEQQIYRIERDELYLAGTSEVPLAALHMEEILDGAALPVRY